MDLQLFFRVLWRFRAIVAVGLVAALGLTFLATFKISSHGLTYRKKALYSAKADLLITQAGFPWGRATAQGTVPGREAERLGIQFADPNRFTSLAYLYATLVTSDPVKALILRSGPIKGEIDAAPVVQDASVTLPLIQILTIDTTPAKAIALNRRTVSAFKNYLELQQSTNEVPAPDRVEVQRVVSPDKAKVYKSRSKTLPILIFLAVGFLTVALAFVLENLRPRARQLAAETVPAAARRSA